MDETVKLIRDMIENGGWLAYNGYILFKSSVDDKGFAVGLMDGKHFEADRYFGFDIVSAIQYLYEERK